MIITIDTAENGCTISYNEPLTTTSMPIPMQTNNRKFVSTDSEIITKLTNVLSDLRADLE